MTTTRREHPTHTTGAVRAHRGTHRAARRTGRRGAGQPPARVDAHLIDAHLDGLFTYCLSVLCEHGAATAALGEALAVAERRRERDRAPRDPALYRPWLYALSRWACLRRLADPSRCGAPTASPVSPAAAERRRELAALAWPEAAGASPEQREALELAVRHQLPVHEVAAVLGLDRRRAETLLSGGACEVERTRTALAVAGRGGCPAVSHIARNPEALADNRLRRETVRHVDECGRCRRAAERTVAAGPWPGTAPAVTGTLTVLAAPRPEVHAAVVAALRARAPHVPRFDRRGFPVTAGVRAGRRDRLRSRAVATTVAATVVVAPVLALWAAYRGEQAADGAAGGDPVAVPGAEDPGGVYGPPHEEAGHVGRIDASPGRDGLRVDVAGAASPEASPSGSPREDRGARDEARRSGRTGPGRLTVEAQASGSATLVTLTASGGRPVSWSASTEASWLRLSRTGGTLRPGESTTIRVTVDEAREPAGAWRARISIAPAGAVVTLEGRGSAPEPSPSPSSRQPTRSPSPSPSPGGGGEPSPTGTRSPQQSSPPPEPE